MFSYSKIGIKSSRNSVKEQDIRFKFATTIDAAKILRNPLKKKKKHYGGFRVASHLAILPAPFLPFCEGDTTMRRKADMMLSDERAQG